jgi:hypothetical protein
METVEGGNRKQHVRFQVLMAASMKFWFVFWDALLCKIIVDQRFRGICCARLTHRPDDGDSRSLTTWCLETHPPWLSTSPYGGRVGGWLCVCTHMYVCMHACIYVLTARIYAWVSFVFSAFDARTLDLWPVLPKAVFLNFSGATDPFATFVDSAGPPPLWTLIVGTSSPKLSYVLIKMKLD